MLEPLFLLRINHAVIGQVIAEFVRWSTNNGLVWAKARMKALKVDYIRYLNNQSPVSGVRRKRGSLLPYGVFSKVYQIRNKRAVLDLLNLYTRFPHEIQDKDFIEASAVIAYNPERNLEQDTKYMDGLLEYVGGSFSCSHKLKAWKPFLLFEHRSSAPCMPLPCQYYLYIPNPKGYAQLYRSYSGKRNKALHNPEDEIFTWKLNKRLVLDTIPKDLFKDLEKGISPCACRGSWPKGYISGEVNFVKERGKLRHVAAPFRFNQHLMRPLGDFVYQFLKENCPWDCTFDQSKPLSIIQNHLKHGGKLWCYDLKKATDCVPLKFQIQLLKALVHPMHHYHINLWEIISKGEWFWRERPDVSVRWTTGQPLGLYPSFGAFALFHGLLIRSLQVTRMKGFSRSFMEKFFIIGDDVIILDENLAMLYWLCCSALKIPMSESKTLVGGEIGEFAGQILSEEGVFSPINWDFDLDQVIDLGYRLGRPILSYVNREARELLELVGDLPYPYGCNWFSPVPYEKKVAIVESLKAEEAFDGDNPELQLSRVLSEVTGNLLEPVGIQELRSEVLETTDNRLGFAYSRLSRETCEKLFALRHKLDPILMRFKTSINQLGWLRTHKSQIQTLRVAHNLELYQHGKKHEP